MGFTGRFIRSVARNKQAKTITAVLCSSVLGTICGTSFMIGYNCGVVNNAAPVLKNYFSKVKLNRTGTVFTSWELTWFWSACVAALPILAPMGCYVGSRSAKKFGRKKTLMCNAVLMILSGMLQTLSKPLESYEMFLMGRIVIGLQIGIGSTVGPMYISEISPTFYRGAFGTLFGSLYTLGVVASAALGIESLFGNENYWPYLFAVPILCALIQLTVMSFCPRSPLFLLIDCRNREEATFSLTRLRGKGYQIEQEIQQMTKEAEATKNLPEVSYHDYWECPELKEPLILALIAVCSHQFSGITEINLFSEHILSAVLSSHGIAKMDYSRYLVAFIPITRLIVSLFIVFYIDKMGRRKCALFSVAGLFICNTFLSFLTSDVSTAGQLCNGIYAGKTGDMMTLFLFFAHSVFFASGVNSLCWTLIPELFRTNARPKATFIAVSVYWVSNFVNAFGFQPVERMICGWAFLVLAAVLFLTFVYFWFKLPVLDSKSANEIASYFENANSAHLSQNKTSSLSEENQDIQEHSPLL